MNTTQDRTLYVRLAGDLHRRLKIHAAATDRPLRVVVARALAAYLDESPGAVRVAPTPTQEVDHG